MAKAQKQKKRNVQQLPPVQPQKTEEDQKNSTDFGGLPKRDIKKNLGCG